mgnify:CR=1 FL=1
MDVRVYDINKNTGKIDKVTDYRQVGTVMIPKFDERTGESNENIGLLTMLVMHPEITIKEFFSLLKDKHIRNCTIRETVESILLAVCGVATITSSYMLLWLLIG